MHWMLPKPIRKMATGPRKRMGAQANGAKWKRAKWMPNTAIGTHKHIECDKSKIHIMPCEPHFRYRNVMAWKCFRKPKCHCPCTLPMESSSMSSDENVWIFHKKFAHLHPSIKITMQQTVFAGECLNFVANAPKIHMLHKLHARIWDKKTNMHEWDGKRTKGITCRKLRNCNVYLVDTVHRWTAMHNAKVCFRHIFYWCVRMLLLVYYWHCSVCSSMRCRDLDQMQQLQIYLHHSVCPNNIHKHLNGNFRDWFFVANCCYSSSAPFPLLDSLCHSTIIITIVMKAYEVP